MHSMKYDENVVIKYQLGVFRMRIFFDEGILIEKNLRKIAFSKGNPRNKSFLMV